MDKFVFTKENIDNLLFQLAKEYKKSNRKNTAEVIIVGGAAIVSKYGFRQSTTDIDSLIYAFRNCRAYVHLWLTMMLIHVSRYAPCSVRSA